MSLGTTVYRIDLAALLAEADALFGKRTGVKDSHDRYANLDVAALLERIDAYPGVALFATNQRSKIDAPHGRRLRCVIDDLPA